MSAALAGVAAYTVLLTLVLATADRVRAPRALPDALTSHGVLPPGAVGPVAMLVTVAETAVLVGLLAGVLDAGPLPQLLIAAAVLFAGYGGYSAYVSGTGRAGPCGCGGTEVPMGPWVSARAGALAGLAGLGAAGPVPPLLQPGSSLLVILLAATTISVLLWHLPAAMHEPFGASDDPPGVAR